jgi:hypothetical protein
MNLNIIKTQEHKELFVSQLPNTFYRKRLELFVSHPDETQVIVVARLSRNRDEWIAYIGYPTLDHIRTELQTETMKYYCTTLHTVTQVASYGDMLDENTAKQLFPEWADLKYRS